MGRRVSRVAGFIAPLGQLLICGLSLAGPAKKPPPQAAPAPVESTVSKEAAEKPDPWAEVIRAAQKEESIVSRGEQAAESRVLGQSLQARKARGLTGLVYGGFGSDTLLFQSPLRVTVTTEGDSFRPPSSRTFSPGGMFFGALFTLGAGLRLPLSLHWDLQARIALGLGVGAFTNLSNNVLFGFTSDLTFRARGSGVSGRAGYFGTGLIAGGQFASLGFPGHTDSATRMTTSSATGILSAGFAGGILEVGGVWGNKEQWDLGLRWSFAGGNFFMNEVSVVFGGAIGHVGRSAAP